MDIYWLGHACIRVRSRQTAVVMDPCDKDSGYDMGRPTADVITISNPHPHHSNVRGVRGDPLTIDGPGEYEVEGVQLIGIPTFLAPPVEDVPAGRNTAFLLDAEELHLAHLGGLGAPLTPDQSEQLASADILVVPIGGDGAFDVAEAARTVRALEPMIVIPVLYPTKGTGSGEDGPLQQFISAVGIEPEEAESRFSIQRRGLGETLRLQLLEPRG